MERTKKLTYIIAAILAAVVFIISTVGGGATKARAAATASAVTKYESTNVWDDLQGAKIDGEGIDLTLYNFDEKKNVQLIAFVEFCYSYRKDKQSDFGLYVYVYNPRGYDWTKTEEGQNIKMRYGANSSANFDTYTLKYLNRSNKAGYEGLFYKFKLTLSEAQRTAILAGVNSAERVYEVSEIELRDDGKNLTAHNVSNTYKYKGYAQGYGPESAESDSLSSTSDGLLTLTLDVHSAAYRPDGTDGTPFTQDMLHSVYFSIPDKILDEYGGLSAVHARWLNALTAPIFVTGNKDVFDDIFEQIDSYEGELYGNTEYALLANGVNVSSTLTAAKQYIYSADSAYNVDGVALRCGEASIGRKQLYGLETAQKLNNLYYAFYADNGNADEYVLNGEKIIEYIKNFDELTSNAGEYIDDGTTDSDGTTGGLGSNGDGTGGTSGGGFGGGGGHGRSANGLVAGKYSQVLFESWDSEYTDKNISADDKYSLTNTKLSQSFWERFLGKPGTQVEYSKTFNNIEAIHPVTATDFRNTEAATCKGLYIDTSYYKDFKAFYDTAAKANETVFLFRYYQSKYISKEVTECIRRYNVNGFLEVSAPGAKVALEVLDTNAYLAQEVLNLDFDIIDVTCTKGGVDTVIANVMSPMDIAPGLTPPVDTTPEPSEKGFDFWQWLADLLHTNKKTAKIIFWCVIGVLALAILLPVLSVLFPVIGTLFKYLLTGVGWIIALPFRLLNALFKRIKERIKERRERKEAVRQEKVLRKDQMAVEHYQNKLEMKELKYRDKQKAKDADKAARQAQKKTRKRKTGKKATKKGKAKKK